MELCFDIGRFCFPLQYLRSRLKEQIWTDFTFLPSLKNSLTMICTWKIMKAFHWNLITPFVETRLVQVSFVYQISPNHTPNYQDSKTKKKSSTTLQVYISPKRCCFYLSLATFVFTCKAWLMEIHPTLAIKSPGLGDPEAGWVTPT